jgi:hypothetical protein
MIELIRIDPVLRMIAAHIDGAGTADGTGRYVMAGYVGFAQSWEDFVEKWNIELNRHPPIPYFRMACIRSHDWRVAHRISREQAEQKLRRLSHLLKGPEILFSVVTSVRQEDFQEIVTDSGILGDKQIRQVLGKFGLKTHYMYLFHSVIARTLWHLHKKLQIWDEVDFFFDRENKLFENANAFLEKIRPQLPPEIKSMLATANERESRNRIQLQAADLLAARARDYYNNPRHETEKLLLAISGKLDPEKNATLIHTRKHLRQMVEALQRHPEINPLVLEPGETRE